MFSEDFPKGQRKPNLISSRASRSVRRLHRKEPKLFRREPEVSYPLSSTSKGLRRPASLRQGENEKIDSSSTGYPRPRDRSTGSNPESTLQALATKVGSSDELASELPQGQRETKAGTEHSIEILAGWLRGCVLKPGSGQNKAGHSLRPTLPPASTNAVRSRYRARGSVSGRRPVRSPKTCPSTRAFTVRPLY